MSAIRQGRDREPLPKQLHVEDEEVGVKKGEHPKFDQEGPFASEGK